MYCQIKLKPWPQSRSGAHSHLPAAEGREASSKGILTLSPDQPTRVQKRSHQSTGDSLPGHVKAEYAYAYQPEYETDQEKIGNLLISIMHELPMIMKANINVV